MLLGLRFFWEGDGILSKVSPGRACLHSHLCPSPIRTISLPMKCLGCFTLKLSRTFYVMFWCGCRKLIPADREIFLKKSFHFQTMSVNWLPWPLPTSEPLPTGLGWRRLGENKIKCLVIYVSVWRNFIDSFYNLEM